MKTIPLICSSLLLGGGALAAARPNLILILADDLGYETIGANGGTSYQTPVLDKLAASGMRFTHCYPMMLTHDPYQPTPDSKDWDPKAIGEAVNRKPAHFGDMVTYMDKLIGKLVAKLDECGLRDNTLVLFLGDNGTGTGTRSLMGQRVVIGRKGRTIDAGMHVPLIANWPDHVAKGVCADLIDTTDFLPTLCDVAAVRISDPDHLDGRSFGPQLRGEKGQPREWIYSWYSPRQGSDKSVSKFTFNHRFKLYRSGRFFDLTTDPDEKPPLVVSSLEGVAAKAARSLQAGLDSFKDARPANLRP